MKGLPDPLCLWQALQGLQIGPPQGWCQAWTQLWGHGGLGLESWLPGGVLGEPACLQQGPREGRVDGAEPCWTATASHEADPQSAHSTSSTSSNVGHLSWPLSARGCPNTPPLGPHLPEVSALACSALRDFARLSAPGGSMSVPGLDPELEPVAGWLFDCSLRDGWVARGSCEGGLPVGVPCSKNGSQLHGTNYKDDSLACESTLLPAL